MDNYFTFFIPCVIGSIIVLLIAVLVLCGYFRRVIKEKNRCIVRWLVENDSLNQELKRVRTEKDAIEQTLDRFINQLTDQSETNNKSNSKIINEYK